MLVEPKAFLVEPNLFRESLNPHRRRPREKFDFYTYQGKVKDKFTLPETRGKIIMTSRIRECVSTCTVGAQTRRSLGHHLSHPLILRLLVLCAPAVLRPRALQDAPAPADPNS